ncbi:MULTISPECIES: cupin domain-containing protein [unclassified Aureimonas]|uniref:cupin domain-containing protein n=1 Tax=unclassified Aureimonas TaxID=2615206 RepID=UPI0006F44427|nr:MULTISPECIES: cupin domain-containing protein [unclassified Aureimonas]KQT52879.1 cupin [Aureimonas sp. Leaf427]KQT80338.1 cupin [Aureimonas sp. Leaf460]
MPVQPFIVEDTGLASEGWSEPKGRGVVGWQTLLSADRTPTAGLTAGIAHLEPGGHLALHRHDPAELYFLTEGVAIVTVEGVETQVGAGACVFIPGNAEHGIRNEGRAPVRFLYVFPTDSFADVDYRFSAG